ncbi:hydrogenase maturation nickel metallochaperone HypA [Pelagibius sp.]|uniref:hydrogenase maturation nickel metallochaperone HypA/HybF n=1 Tax=Pelagibius sp. TaxID=1931238 RepID=UPI00262CF7D7|nr:hydrogenase maturation nickel metallochaperone HypA [Pelagibius sp.]
MHELGLTRNIVAIVGEHAGSRRVRRVCLAVGPLACVEREALSFCFDIVAEGTALEGAALEFLDAEGDVFMIKNFEVEEAA